MSEEIIGKSKKSSRLNAKKEDKVELVIDRAWSPATVPSPPTQIDIIIHSEDKINEAPRVLKDVAVYKNEKQEIVAFLLVDFLKNSEYCKEDETVSFWDDAKSSYIFGFNVPREVREVTRNIPPRFLVCDAVRIAPRSSPSK
jgi:hypothetical protein